MSGPPSSTGVPILPGPSEPVGPPGGCARGALIGCGAAAILVLIVLALLLIYARRRPEVLTDLMMGQIDRNFAPEVTAEQKERLHAAYAAFRKSLGERRAGREPADRLRAILSGAARGPIGPEQVRDLTQAFERAGAGPPSPGATASPAPLPTPTPVP